ncbi:hypothetical protein [uncultured Brevundimonas sp.]|uniref:hypothetical protein n=1 Tax=uncultured Brevundimonas sp. TaxID=213418 RepID=UPI00260CEEBA|nr:hypothetical protein [uncultured Brevundimonas sp.]
MAVKPTLRLDGDGIDDLIEDVEEAFALRFADGELQSVATVGDLHERLMSRLRTDPGLCATSMAFYRIRRGLVAQGWKGRIAPATPLPTDGAVAPRRFLQRLASDSGLRGLHAGLGRAGSIGAWSVLGVIIIFVLALAERAWILAWAGVVLLVLSVGLLILDRGRLPRGVRTVGDLARQAVTQNHGGLIAQGAGVRGDEVWTSVQSIAADSAGLSPADVGRDTTIFKQKTGKAA